MHAIKQFVKRSLWRESLKMDQSFTLSLVVMRTLTRGGGKKRKRVCPEVSATRLAEKKRSLLEVPRDDRNMSCAKALWTAYKHKTLDRSAFDASYTLQKWRKVPFQRECQTFQRDVGIPVGTLCGPAELERFAAYFQPLGYYIVVVNSERGRQANRYGLDDSEDKVLGLHYYDNH